MKYCMAIVKELFSKRHAVKKFYFCRTEQNFFLLTIFSILFFMIGFENFSGIRLAVYETGRSFGRSGLLRNHS